MIRIIGIILIFIINTGYLKHEGAENVSASKELRLNAPIFNGIKFSSINFEQAKKESQTSGKLIFVFAYTDWCNPCNAMNNSSFKDGEVGKLYNENFINLKIEMEKDYDRQEIARNYRIAAYPTYTIIDGNGRLIKQQMGFKSEAQLIALANEVL